MREVRKRSVIPIYGAAAVWVLTALIFPLYRPFHFVILFAASFVSFLVLSKLFPGTVEQIEIPPEPVATGNAEIDALLREGERAVSEMRRLRGAIRAPAVARKVDGLIDVTRRIFDELAEDPADYQQVRRFSNYYLPTTVKLLHAYDRMDQQGIAGENISGTMTRIEDILDTTLEAYRKQLDALFANQALDIETDITVLEAMLKREGLSGKDFD